MTYKQTLFFIGKCLTIDHEEKNLIDISKVITSNKVDWDSVVKVSTAHFVFPALYCNLKRANLLSFLPKGLVGYMKHITDLNRERNLQIIEQAKEINQLLLDNGITPIFLKGTGNLLEGLYKDIAERMVGDIDFIVSPETYKKAIQTLKKHDYSKFFDVKYDLPGKHFPRLIKSGAIAAVEVHSEIAKNKYSREFNYDIIKDNTLELNSISFLNFNNQLALSIIAKQINDDGQYYNTISLRNAYDVLLLSKKVDPLLSIEGFTTIFHPLNNFLAICDRVFSTTIKHKKTSQSEKYIQNFYHLISDKNFSKRHHKKWERKLLFKNRFSIILKSIYRKDYRRWLIQKIMK